MTTGAWVSALGPFSGWFQQKDEAEILHQKILKMLEGKAPYVQPGELRDKILDALIKAKAEFDNGDQHQARQFLAEAQHNFEAARCSNQLYSVYHKRSALLVSVFYLLIFGALALLPFWYELDQSGTPVRSLMLLQTMIALAGGGMGGMTAVLAKAVGLKVQTEAITAQVTWFWVKPILGAIMGFVTYLALVSGFSFVSDHVQLDRPYGFFLIGFLGGYLESFSTNLLNQIADTLQKDE